MTRTGVLYQGDARQSPEERVRSAVAAFLAKYGCRPSLALVRPGGAGWPAAVDGVRVEPSATIPYPTYVLLSTEEPHATRSR